MFRFSPLAESQIKKHIIFSSTFSSIFPLINLFLYVSVWILINETGILWLKHLQTEFYDYFRCINPSSLRMGATENISRAVDHNLHHCLLVAPYWSGSPMIPENAGALCCARNRKHTSSLLCLSLSFSGVSLVSKAQLKPQRIHIPALLARITS